NGIERATALLYGWTPEEAPALEEELALFDGRAEDPLWSYHGELDDLLTVQRAQKEEGLIALLQNSRKAPWPGFIRENHMPFFARLLLSGDAALRAEAGQTLAQVNPQT